MMGGMDERTDGIETPFGLSAWPGPHKVEG